MYMYLYVFVCIYIYIYIWEDRRTYWTVHALVVQQIKRNWAEIMTWNERIWLSCFEMGWEVLLDEAKFGKVKEASWKHLDCKVARERKRAKNWRSNKCRNCRELQESESWKALMKCRNCRNCRRELWEQTANGRQWRCNPDTASKSCLLALPRHSPQACQRMKVWPVRRILPAKTWTLCCIFVCFVSKTN